MSVFQFQAKKVNGEEVEGEVRAESEAEARLKLRERQLVSIELSNLNRGGVSKVKKSIGLAPKVNSKDLRLFTRQFEALVTSGIPVVMGLQEMARGSSVNMRSVVEVVVENLQAGHSLSNSMAVFPSVFSKLYLNLISAGEESGALGVILKRLANYIEDADRLKSQMIRALWYPIVILIISILVLSVLFIFVVPSFMTMFTMSGKSLPWITTAVIGTSKLAASYWYVGIAGMVGAYALIKMAYKSDQGRKIFDHIILRLPLFGPIFHHGALARSCRVFSVLLGSNVRVVDSLDMTALASDNYVIEKTFLEAKERVISGHGLAQALAFAPDVPDLVVDMVKVGEETGKLDDMFEHIANFYEDEVENSVKALMSLMEPFLIVFLGGIVAVVIVAMYLPIFGLADNTGGMDLGI